ncbi:coiled-coil domain-containing protein 120 isoform X1 [Patagioenas fasciata]|uniref:coiled-coil domain-containing protein 120 isoform X1 n=1 Tax=Patagioenas fasciata TaxID=372321 RepID=UPI003A9A51BC
MELRGHILPPGSYSPAGPAGRLQELRERQRGLRQALGLRLRELRRLCLQEAELTGQLPPEYPLEPGERPQPPPRRRAGGPPRGPLPEAARAARREVAVQLQVVEAARRLAAAPGLLPEQRRRRQRLQAEAAQRLRQLRAQLGTAAHDENGSLCDLPPLENGALPPPKPPLGTAPRPSPPRAGPVSPERRPPWPPDLPGRRSSLASPASPARTLPRSASSFEGRSVPATPVLARGPRGPPLCRPEALGLPPRPWSGSQDSQLGGPAAPAPPPQTAPRTRRSNSSEALIDWGGGGAPEGPPEARAPPSAEQRRSQKWLALEGLRDWYLRHAGGPPPQRPPPAWAPPPRRRDPPPGLPHSLSYAGALAPRASGDPPAAAPPPPPDPQPPGTLV